MLKNKDLIEDGYALYHSVGHRPNGSQEMAAAIMKIPEVNTYMPVSAGIESTAALSAAILSFLPTKYDAARAALDVTLQNWSINFL